jgi:hypothetical protein
MPTFSARPSTDGSARIRRAVGAPRPLLPPTDFRTRNGEGRRAAVVRAADPTPLERAVAVVVATGGVASGRLAGVLLGLDSVVLDGPDVTVPSTCSGRRNGVRRRDLPPERVTTVDGIRCTDALQTLVDLAAIIDDPTWEQALESALRRRLTSVEALEHALDTVRRSRTPGAKRIQRVLAARPCGAQPTESLLETLMVQLARDVPGLRDPVRQLVVSTRRPVRRARRPRVARARSLHRTRRAAAPRPADLRLVEQARRRPTKIVAT